MSSSDRARRFWEAAAERYDAQSAWLERRLLGRGRAWACARAEGHTLDVGVGTGANLAELPPGVRVTGVDWSGAMVEQARARARALGIDADLRQADAAALPIPDASFDTVLATFVLCCVPDERAVLAECVRVLRPGGRLLLADHVPSTNPVVRGAQRALDAVTARANGERLVRRPALVVAGDARLEVVASERWSHGVIEVVQATRRTGIVGAP